MNKKLVFPAIIGTLIVIVIIGFFGGEFLLRELRIGKLLSRSATVEYSAQKLIDDCWLEMVLCDRVPPTAVEVLQPLQIMDSILLQTVQVGSESAVAYYKIPESTGSGSVAPELDKNPVVVHGQYLYDLAAKRSLDPRLLIILMELTNKTPLTDKDNHPAFDPQTRVTTLTGVYNYPDLPYVKAVEFAATDILRDYYDAKNGVPATITHKDLGEIATAELNPGSYAVLKFLIDRNVDTEVLKRVLLYKGKAVEYTNEYFSYYSTLYGLDPR